MRRAFPRWVFSRQRLVVMAAGALIGAFGLKAGSAPDETMPRWHGIVRVVDGDTLAIDKTSFRLWGINAAELQTADGKKARDHMAALTGQGEVTCIDTGARSYERVVAHCYDGKGYDLAASMVSHGYANDWPEYSGGRFLVMQLQAQTGQRGLHAAR